MCVCVFVFLCLCVCKCVNVCEVWSVVIMLAQEREFRFPSLTRERQTNDWDRTMQGLKELEFEEP